MNPINLSHLGKFVGSAIDIGCFRQNSQLGRKESKILIFISPKRSARASGCLDGRRSRDNLQIAPDCTVPLPHCLVDSVRTLKSRFDAILASGCLTPWLTWKGTFRLTLVSQLYSVLGMNDWAQAIDYVNYNAPMNGIIGLTLAPPLYSVFAMDVWAQAIHGANYNALVNSQCCRSISTFFKSLSCPFKILSKWS
nr:uncharacterized protein LOC119165322 [Rhipicephalus microplus]